MWPFTSKRRSIQSALKAECDKLPLISPPIPSPLDRLRYATTHGGTFTVIAHWDRRIDLKLDEPNSKGAIYSIDFVQPTYVVLQSVQLSDTTSPLQYAHSQELGRPDAMRFMQKVTQALQSPVSTLI